MQIWNQSKFVISGVLAGIFLTLIVSQYPGIIEIHTDYNGISIIVNGHQ
jgi:hypothetical protein